MIQYVTIMDQMIALFSEIFLMWTVFKVFIELVTILLLFYVLIFWLRSRRNPSSQTRDRSHTPCPGKGYRNHWPVRDVPVVVLLSLP